VSLRV